MSIDVFLTRTASFLPLEPVGNDEMEAVLGMVGGKPSKARRIGVAQQRHSASPLRARSHHRQAGDDQCADGGRRRCAHWAMSARCNSLATATSRPDQLMPGHGVMVHGELGWPRLEVLSMSGICVAGAAAFKHAWLAVRAGDARARRGGGFRAGFAGPARTQLRCRSRAQGEGTGRASRDRVREGFPALDAVRRRRCGAAGEPAARAAQPEGGVGGAVVRRA